MAEQPIPPHGSEPAPTPAPRRKPRRRGRMILIGVGVFLLLLVLLVLFAPAIASTGWARGFVLGKVNEHLNGAVVVDDWRLGWMRPISLDGISVRDAEGNEVLAITTLNTELTLLGAIRQNFALGEVVIDGLQAHIVRYEDGSTNLDHLLKESDPAAGQDSGTQYTDTQDAGPTELPDVSGAIIIRNAGGTFRDVALNRTAAFELAGEVKIPSINDPITNDLRLITRIDGTSPGSLSAVGQVKIAENNRLSIDPQQLRQNLKLGSLDVASLAFVIPADSGISHLAGIFTGEVDAQGTREGIQASAALQARDFSIGGPALAGDTYASDSIRLTLPPTAIALPADGQDFAAARILIGDGSEQQALRIQFQQGTITVRADAQMSALARLADNQAPGSKGNLAVRAEVDMGALARQLPHLMQINPDLRDLQGRFDLDARLALEPRQATPTLVLNLRDVSAQNTRTGQPVRLQPIALNLSARHLGGGGAIPDLRDIAIKLTSGFATADINGQNLGSIAGAIHGQLDDLQREAGQFIDFGGVQLAGRFTAGLNANGDFTRPGGSSAARLTVDLTDLTLAGIQDMPPIRRERVQFGVVGNLRRGPEGGAFIEGVRNVNLTLQAGPQEGPWFDMALAADAIELLPDSAAVRVPIKVVRYDLNKFNVDLIAAEKQVAWIEQALAARGIDISSGVIALKTSGSFDQDVLTIAGFDLTTHDISAMQARRPLVDHLTTRLDLAGRVELGEAATVIHLSRLKLSEPRNYIALEKTSGGELMFSLPHGGGFAGRGQVQVALSLGFANDVLRAMQKEIVAEGAAGQVRRGYLQATLDLNQPQPTAPTQVALNATVSNLQVTTATGKPLDAEKLTLAANGTMAADQSALTLTNVDLASPFATVKLNDGRLNLASDSPLTMVQAAKVVVDVPDAGAVWSVYEAFIPPTAQPAAAADEQADAPLPPLRITGGQLRIEATVREEQGRSTLTLERLAGDQVELVRGPARHTLSPFTVALSAQVEGDAAGQIRQLLVNQLDANFGFLQLQAAEPVRITGLAGAQPHINGSITGRGDVERVMAMINLLGASPEPPAYTGAFDFAQQVNTQDQQIALEGSLNLRDLKPTDPDAARVDDEIRLVNTIRLDLAEESLAIQRLHLTMPRTQSLVVMVQGGVQQFATQRQLDLKAYVKTDWERLWQLAYPILPAETRKELADARFFGIEERNWTIQGSFPADKPFHEAIRTVSAAGGISIQSAQALGLDVRELHVPFKLEQGRMTLGFAPQRVQGQYTPNGQINGGQLNLGNIVIDLTHPDGPRLSAPENYKLAIGMSMNPVLADKFFGQFINPAFGDAKQASGLIDVVIVYCENFPLSELTGAAVTSETATALQPRPRDRGDDAFEQWRRSRQGGAPDATAQSAMATVKQAPGRLDVRYSIRDVQLGSPFFENVLRMNRVNLAIQDGEFQVANGVIRTRVPMLINNNLMLLDGALRPDNLQILNMVAAIPVGLLPEEWRRSLPANLKLQVPVSGTMDNLQLDIQGAIKQNLLNPQGVGGLLEDLLNKDKREQPRGNEPISQPPDANPAPRQGGSIQPEGGAAPRQKTPAPAPQPGNTPPSQQREQTQPRQPDPFGGLLDLLNQREREKHEKER